MRIPIPDHTDKCGNTFSNCWLEVPDAWPWSHEQSLSPTIKALFLAPYIRAALVYFVLTTLLVAVLLLLGRLR